MRIVFTSFYEKSSMGGGPGIITHELPYVFSKKYEVLFICPGRKNRLTKVNKNLKIAYISSETNRELSIPFLSVPNVFHIFKTLSDFKPDVIHSQEVDPISLITQIWAIVHNVAFFHTIHVFPGRRSEFGISEASKIFSQFYSSNLISRYIMNYFNNTDALITLNQYVENNIRDFGYTGKTFIIPNGINLDDYRKCKPTNIKSNKKELLFVGFLSKRKNQIYLIEVMKYLPQNYHLTLIGDALNQNYKKEIVAYICENKLNKNITIKNKLPHKSVTQYLNRTHFFVSASIMELQSLVILEALASGTPVIGLENETVDELIDKNVGVKLPKDTTPAQFAKEVQKLCALSIDEYQSLSRNAQERVSCLDWNIVSEKIVVAYQKVIKDKKDRDQKQKYKMINKVIVVFKDLRFIKFIRSYIKKILSYLPFDKEEKEIKDHKMQPKKLLTLKWQYLYLFITILTTLSGVFIFRLIRNTGKIKKNLTKKG